MVLLRHAEPYLLGHTQAEERRLRTQAEELRGESARLFDRIGISTGSRAIDLGSGVHCGDRQQGSKLRTNWRRFCDRWHAGAYERPASHRG